MFKKGLPFILAVMIFIGLPTAAFAGIQLNPVDQGDIILIEPQIGSEKQVFVKESMAISIRMEGDAAVDVSLYKVMPSSREAELETACESEMITAASSVPFEVISGGSIVARDMSRSADERAPEAVRTADALVVSENRSEQANIIDGTEALLQKDRLSSKERQEVIEAFIDARKALKRGLLRLEDAYEDLMKEFPEGFEEDRTYTSHELDVIEDYLVQVNRVLDKCSEFEDAQRAYEAIFEIPLFGPEDLSDTGILPYYQKTVEKITPGLYKFVFSDHDTHEIIEVIEFEVSKKEELTEEAIKEAMPLSLGQLLKPAVKEEEIAADPDMGAQEGTDEADDAEGEDELDRSPAVNDNDVE